MPHHRILVLRKHDGVSGLGLPFAGFRASTHPQQLFARLTVWPLREAECASQTR